MSGVRAGRCWGGGEDGEDERLRGRGRGEGKLGERESECWTLERGEGRGEERRGEGAFPRTVGPHSGVGCPALISAHSGSGFSPNPVLPKQSERWVDKERDLCIFFFIWT